MIASETLSIEAVSPGRRLTQAVLDKRGRVLMPAGCELAEDDLQTLLAHDVGSVHVECPPAADAASRQALQEEIGQDLKQRFRHAGDSAETAVLRAVLLAFLSGASR